MVEEKLDLKIEEHIFPLAKNELVKVATKLERKEEDIEGKSRRVLSKLARKSVETNFTNLAKTLEIELP